MIRSRSSPRVRPCVRAETLAQTQRCLGTVWLSRAVSPPGSRSRARSGSDRRGVGPRWMLSWRQRLGRGGRGTRTIGGDPSGHHRPVGAIDEPRSAQPMDTSSTSWGRWGRGRPWMGGSGSTRGGVVRVWCTQSQDVIPFDVLDHRLWPLDKRAAQDLG